MPWTLTGSAALPLLLHSLRRPAGAVQLRTAISERFGVEVPATAALDFPNVLALADFVAQRLAPSSRQSSAGQLATAVSLEAAWSNCSGEVWFSTRMPAARHTSRLPSAGLRHYSVAQTMPRPSVVQSLEMQ